MAGRWRRRALAALGAAGLRATALGATAAAGEAAARDLSEDCHGYDEQFARCEDLPACGVCTPVDCKFANWEAWYPGGGCSGLIFRERNILVPSNECGRPCQGAQIQSQRSLLPRCSQRKRDCQFAVWSEWTSCQSDTDQATRMRGTEHEGNHFSHGCDGPTKETRACSARVQEPCRFAPWQQWTPCSSTCGEGRRTRLRHIEQKAVNGGKACSDSLLEASTCKERTCPSSDCKVKPWAEWSSCGQELQRYRERAVIEAASNGGAPCPTSLRETKGCAGATPAGCVLTEWSKWTQCDKTCGGGQRIRQRQLSRPNDEGGQCERHSLKETAPCNERACFPEAHADCKFEEWGPWSHCSVDCGTGQESRQRKVHLPGLVSGKGCSGPMEELRACERLHCSTTDCKWSQWDTWSACSRSCGGGTTRRTRMVQVAPSQGGQRCAPNSKAEAKPCNTQTCSGECVDGRWGIWMEWTECSATCSRGVRSRRRDVEVQPNSCGHAVLGLREQFQVCVSSLPCVQNQDCRLSQWGVWSQCSSSCFGIRQRNRFVAAFASGNGRPCLKQVIKAIESCNPGAGDHAPYDCGPNAKVDCVLNPWQAWSGCSATCGGGQRKRTRTVHIPPRFGGRPCHGTLAYTAACNENPCPLVEHTCTDCVWGAWDSWSECSGCGGQKVRHRSIEQLASDCGAPCDLKSAKETTSCDIEGCNKAYFCAWNAWSESGACASCGSSAAMRNRAMRLTDAPTGGYLFKATGPRVQGCAGTQLNVSLCPIRARCGDKCRPQPCEFGEWSSWTAPTWIGLCERHRAIETMNNECGDPCSGATTETMRCGFLETTKAKDCVLSSWSEWSRCLANDYGQRFRSRRVVGNPSNGGEPCVGDLRETMPCSQARPTDCELSAWTSWSGCSRTCGLGGLQERKRHVRSDASGGGHQCKGSLRELRLCSDALDPCPVSPEDCKLSRWSSWSACDADSQRYRSRRVVQPALEGGKSCDGALQETMTCKVEAVDCVMSAWTPWSDCDATCGGGQSERQRQIQTFPEHGGRACPDALIETQGCNGSPCSAAQDCELSFWQDWGECSSSCGTGQQSRKRAILGKPSRSGAGCDSTLAQTRPCNKVPCRVQDCQWGLWSQWSGCTCTCGGGTRMRNREIAQEPLNGGARCPAGDKEQVEACNTQACSNQVCRDGIWQTWSHWSTCSASCERGVSMRRRAVAIMADECGRQPLGKDLDVRICNEGVSCTADVDCRLAPWDDWSDCSATCSGVKRRSRRVAVYGRGNGRYCHGALQETWPCNPSPHEQAPAGCADARGARDCKLAPWTAWSPCSASCGGGQTHRSREVAHHALSGGRGCRGPLYVVRECRRQACGGAAGPVDCLYSQWEEWGACGKCSGERKRFRHVVRHPRNGGKSCEPKNTEQLGTCPIRCSSGAQLFCTWQGWSAWSDCSKSCGEGGKRKRRRHLHPSSDSLAPLPPAEELISQYEAVYRRTQELERRHLRELAMAFTAGCASLVAAFTVVRGACKARGRLQGRSSIRAAFGSVSSLAGAANRGLHSAARQEHPRVVDVELPLVAGAE